MPLPSNYATGPYLVYKRMMTHDDFCKQLPDYTLNLLPPRQLGVIEHHISHCTSCRQAMLHERKIGQLVHSTINAAAQPDSTRLRTLMPKPPQKRRSRWNQHRWQKQLAPVMLILVLALGVFLTQRVMPSGSLPAFVTTAHAATATSTNTPTATAVQAFSAKQAGSGPVNIVPESNKQSVPMPVSSPLRPVTTPDPLPTPVASVMQLLVQ
jgi:anti-sigma factor RsiW